MAARLKRSWSFFEATRYEKGRWLFKMSVGDKDYSLWPTGAMTLGYYGELRALGFRPPWIDREAEVLDAWIGEVNKHIDLKTGLLNGPSHGAPRRDRAYISSGYDWNVQNRVFMTDRYTLPPGAMHGGDPLPTREAAIKSFNGKNWSSPYGSANTMGHEIRSHQQVLRAADKEVTDEIIRTLHELFDGKFRDGYWGAPDPNGNMKTLVTYSRMDWPIPDHKKLIDFTLSRATESAGFAGSGCSSFNRRLGPRGSGMAASGKQMQKGNQSRRVESHRRCFGRVFSERKNAHSPCHHYDGKGEAATRSLYSRRSM